jgi:hypothetical protein
MSVSSQIKKAFSNVARPSDDALFQFDSEGADAVFRGHRWDEISVADLHCHSFALLAFTPSAFVYFLPAFMIASLENKHLGLTDAVIDAVCPPKNNPKRPSYERWWSHLSRAQRLCVIAFVEEFRSENPEHFEPIITVLHEHVEG